MATTARAHLEEHDHIEARDLSRPSDPFLKDTVSARFGSDLTIFGTLDELEAAMRRILADLDKIRDARTGTAWPDGVQACLACADKISCSLNGCEHTGDAA